MDTSDLMNDEALIYTCKDEEERGWCTGDRDLILSCYAPDFVSYDAHGSGDTSTWTILDPDLEALRSRLAGFNLQDRGWSPDRREHVFEHLQIHGNAAFAVIQHGQPGTTPSHRTLWTFKKTEEGWKISSFITHVGGARPFPIPVELPKGLLLAAGGILLGLGVGYYLGKKG